MSIKNDSLKVFSVIVTLSILSGYYAELHRVNTDVDAVSIDLPKNTIDILLSKDIFKYPHITDYIYTPNPEELYRYTPILPPTPSPVPEATTVNVEEIYIPDEAVEALPVSEEEYAVAIHVWNYLIQDMGLSEISAAGILGNMMVESGCRSLALQPNVLSPGGSYYGLCQWNTFGHHSSINGGTVDEQLAYLSATIVSEMGEYEYDQFINADSVETASIIFGRWYERCGDPYNRQSCARTAYEYFVNISEE